MLQRLDHSVLRCANCKNTGKKDRKWIDKSVWSDVLRPNTCILEVGRLGRHIKVEKVSLSLPFSFEGPPNCIVTPFFIASQRPRQREILDGWHMTYDAWSSWSLLSHAWSSARPSYWLSTSTNHQRWEAEVPANIFWRRKYQQVKQDFQTLAWDNCMN